MHTQAFPSASTTLSEIAAEAATQFQATTRNTACGPEPIVKLKDSTPPWLSQAIYDAHDGMLPDDWKFSTAQEACEAIAHGGGYENMQDTAEQFAEDADIYTTDLRRWLTSHPTRPRYCEDTHQGASGEETIRAGQALERRELFHAILTAIEDEQIERATQ